MSATLQNSDTINLPIVLHQLIADMHVDNFLPSNIQIIDNTNVNTFLILNKLVINSYEASTVRICSVKPPRETCAAELDGGEEILDE